MKVTGLDHLVLNVSDAERSLAYYSGVLGLPGERVEEWRRRQAPFPSTWHIVAQIGTKKRSPSDAPNLTTMRNKSVNY